jgi:hypothetical protein
MQLERHIPGQVKTAEHPDVQEKAAQWECTVATKVSEDKAKKDAEKRTVDPADFRFFIYVNLCIQLPPEALESTPADRDPTLNLL